MLVVEVLRTLTLTTTSSKSGSLDHLSAASGLVFHGDRLYVVADDELHLAVFDAHGSQPGHLFRLFDGAMPQGHAARKAVKPDIESLLWLPSSRHEPWGALLAMGSGSKPNRQRALIVGLDAQGDPTHAAREIDLAALYAPLHAMFDDVNIEGAFVVDEALCLLQRGNARTRLNACIRFDRSAFQTWLRGQGAVPVATHVQPIELGLIDGVPLSFTDGCAMVGGGWVFSAAAEVTDDSYADGKCVGSAVGWVDSSGRLGPVQCLSRVCKVEGIAVDHHGRGPSLLMVTDADDRATPALLLRAALPHVP